MKKKVFIHIGLVLLFLAIPFLSSPDFGKSFRMLEIPMFWQEMAGMILLIIFFYINYFCLMPMFYNKKKYWTYFLLNIICFLLYTKVPERVFPEHFSPHPDFHPKHFPKPQHFIPLNFFRQIIPYAFSILSSFYLRLFIQNREMEAQKTKAELRNLTYQLQPHFLFNILNNIYALSLTKSDLAPESILKLSNVMRYVVDKYDKNEALLSEELDYLKNYIELQRLRTDESLIVSYSESIQNYDLKIAPMLLVVFVENAFKYGFSTENVSELNIKIMINQTRLDFEIINKIQNYNFEDNPSSKIGLKNTIERLEKIYPKKYELIINETSTEYSVKLTLELI